MCNIMTQNRCELGHNRLSGLVITAEIHKFLLKHYFWGFRVKSCSQGTVNITKRVKTYLELYNEVGIAIFVKRIFPQRKL